MRRNGIEAEANIMSNADVDKVFSGSIPQLYEEYLVPMIFAPYAVDMVQWHPRYLMMSR